MISGLPLQGKPVTGKIESHKFRDMVEELLGERPPEKVEGKKGSKTGGLKTTWLETKFGTLPEGANEITAERLYLLPLCYPHLFMSSLFQSLYLL